MEALGTSLGEFFSEEKDEQIVFTANDFFENFPTAIRSHIQIRQTAKLISFILIWVTGNPLPSFEGEPKLVDVVDDIDVLYTASVDKFKRRQ